jgi:cobalamin biosynthesis Mg chelatase CobN
MACFPGLAAAEENSGIQYETDVPTVPSHEGSDNIPSQKNSGGSNSSDPGAESSGDDSSGGVSSGGGNSGTGGTSTGQGNQAQGGADGKAADGSKPAGGGVGGAQELPTAESVASKTASDDGSSPLVPILIAIVVLAAISIGAYYYRQRRQGPGSTVSPNAN